MKNIIWILLPFWFLACSKEDDTGNPGNTMSINPGMVADTFSIGFEAEYEPFVGLITRNTCGVCGQSGHPLFDGFLAANQNVNGVSFNYSSSDPLYHPEAREYVDFIQINGTPNYIVNNRNFSSSLDPWKDAVNQESTRNVLALMAMEGSIVTEDTAEISVRFVPKVNLNGSNIQIAIYLLENNVESPQQDYGASPTIVENYIHNHVFRASAAGIFGERINEQLAVDDTIRIQATIPLPVQVNTDNIYFTAIAFATDSSGDPVDVIQSQRLHR